MIRMPEPQTASAESVIERKEKLLRSMMRDFSRDFGRKVKLLKEA